MAFLSPEMQFNVCVEHRNYIILLENVKFYIKVQNKESESVFWHDLRQVLAKKYPKITQN